MNALFSIVTFLSAAVFSLYSNDALKKDDILSTQIISDPVIGVHKNIAVLITLDHLEGKNEKLGVLIRIPDTFKQILEDVSYTFIPSINSAKWSEKITVNIHGFKKLSASYVNEHLKKEIEAYAVDLSVKKVEIRSNKFCDSAKLIITYTTTANQREILSSYAYSDPYACSYIQYKIALLNNKTEQEGLDQIYKFGKENLLMVKF